MDLDTVIAALRVVVGLGAVFGALFFLHRWIQKRNGAGAGKERQIAVVARQGLGAKAGIAVVDAAGKRYLLGVTEHSVTLLDTLGEVPGAMEPRLITTQPVTVARFEQELRTVTISTGDVPILVHGAAESPDGPITTTLAITSPTRLPSDSTPVAHPPRSIASFAVPDAAPLTRRAAREAEQRRVQPAGGPLAGSVLSPATWRQTRDALRRTR